MGDEGDDELELPRALALAWGVASSPQRGPKRELSIEKIVDAAVEIADTDGLGAVSMSAVAGRLGFTTMSLYRYVTAKDELLELMGEAGLGQPPASIAEAATWREGLLLMFRGLVDHYLTHPWMLDLPVLGMPGTPNSLAWLDAGLQALASTPLSWDDRAAVLLMVSGQARWSAILGHGLVLGAARAGVSPSEHDAMTTRLMARLATPESFPALAEAVQAGAFAGGDDPVAFGIGRILDGVEQHIARVSADGEAPTAPVTDPPLPESDAFPKDAQVKEARSRRREAEKQLREAVKNEREAIKHAREQQERERESN